MADPVPRVGRVSIGSILYMRNPTPGQIVFNLLTRCIQQRPDEDPPHRGNAGQAGQPRTPDQIQQHRFGIVAAVVGRSHPQRADLFRRFA